MPSKTGVCFPQSCGSPIIKLLWPQGQIPQGFLVPLLDSQAGKPNSRVQNVHNGGRASLVFSSLCVTHPQDMGVDFILILPLIPSRGRFYFFFFFWMWGIFFGGIPAYIVNGCSTSSCDFGALVGDECASFYSTILK